MLRVELGPVSNRQDWLDQVEVFDEANNLVDIATAVIVLAVRNKQANHWTSATIGASDPLLLAQTADGTIIVPALGVFQFFFPVSAMRSLCVSRQYEVGCTMQLNGLTQSLFTGTVSVLDGIVP
jgi:hypothetical protein